MKLTKKEEDALIRLRRAIHRFSEVGLLSVSESMKQATIVSNEMSKKLYKIWFESINNKEIKWCFYPNI